MQLEIFHKTDSVDDAFQYLKSRLERLYLTPQGLDQVKLTASADGADGNFKTPGEFSEAHEVARRTITKSQPEVQPVAASSKNTCRSGRKAQRRQV